jgi:hypothetical protein
LHSVKEPCRGANFELPFLDPALPFWSRTDLVFGPSMKHARTQYKYIHYIKYIYIYIFFENIYYIYIYIYPIGCICTAYMHIIYVCLWLHFQICYTNMVSFAILWLKRVQTWKCMHVHVVQHWNLNKPKREYMGTNAVRHSPLSSHVSTHKKLLICGNRSHG